MRHEYAVVRKLGDHVAATLAEWLSSGPRRDLIAGYRPKGRPLFFVPVIPYDDDFGSVCLL
jgi:hypothetical protein